MKYKTRKRLALFVLLIGLPVYIGLVVGVMGLIYDRFGELPLAIELPIYIVFGIVAVFPLKSLFKGLGQPDPDAPPPPPED